MNAEKTNRNGWPLGRAAFIGALCAAMSAPAFGQDIVDGGEDEQVQVTDYGTVTLAVQDTDLAQVLEMLSIQSQKNIITSKNVSATISANLYDVTFHQALDAILKVNGYDYVEEGNFIYIYTQAELDEIVKSQLSTESRIFELSYLSATDANELITPLLSDVGKSSFRGDVQPGIQPDTADAGQDDWAFTAMLVVNDYPENLEEIANLLEDLDVPPQQVLIESTILQTTLDEANAWGVDFSFIADVDFLDFTNPLAGVNNLLSGDDPANGFQPEDNNAKALVSSPGNTAGPGTFKLGIVSNDVSFFLKVLDEVTDSTVLARPKIMCLNRQRAEVLVGARVGYLSTTATETSTTQTVEFLDTGIQLLFRPFISRDGMIRLELAPSVSEASLRSVTDATGVSVTIPDELTNEITTNVRVKDGQTIVLGGLYRESTRVTRRQVPVLGDIPIVGAAFKGHDDTVDRDEIIFLITPSIVNDSVMWQMGEDGLDEAHQARVGAREGLLPWSREKNTAMYNNRAFEAYNRGDLDQALNNVNNSLRRQANQAEMVRLRDKILGAREERHERSILERTFRDHLGYTASKGGTETGDEVVFYDTTYQPRTPAAEWTPPSATATATDSPWTTDVQSGGTTEFAPASEELTPMETAPATTSGTEDSRWLPEMEGANEGNAWTSDGNTWTDDENSWTEDAEASVPEIDEAPEFTPESFESTPESFTPAQPFVEDDKSQSFAPQGEIDDDAPATESFASESFQTTEAPEYAPEAEAFQPAVESTTVSAPQATVSDMQPFERIERFETTEPVATTEGKWLPELTSTTPASMMPTSTMASAPASDQESTDRFVDLFIHEYFSALGLQNLSPFADAGAEDAEIDSFDAMTEMDLVEAQNEERP